MNADITKMILGDMETLEKLHAKSTKVVAWYAHPYEVRGPYGRWFTVSNVAFAYENMVASTADDAAYAAHAMNIAPLLVDEIRLLRAALEKIANNKTGNYFDATVAREALK